MESIDATIDRLFPTGIRQAEPVSMEQLATIRAVLKRDLPPDTTIDLTILLGTIQLGVWIAHERKWYRRTCVVHMEASS